MSDNSIFEKLAKETDHYYVDLDKNIKKSRLKTNTIDYLSRSYYISFLAGTATTATTGILLGILSYLKLVSPLISAILVIFIILPTSTLLSLAAMLYYPELKKNKLEKKINRDLPYGITLMYALSRGGMNMVDIIEEIANSEESYGELSKEMQSVLNDMKYFGKDSQTAIRDLIDRTPSRQLSEFLQDLVSRTESGANITYFLEDKSESSMEKAKSSQESLLEILDLLSEFYVTLFVAAPVFVIVILMSLLMLGTGEILHVLLVIYGMLPIMSMGYLVLIATITDTGEDESDYQLKEEGKRMNYKKAKEKYSHIGEKTKKDIEKMKERHELYQFKENPLQTLKDKPLYSLIGSIPLTLLYLTIIALAGPNPLNIVGQPVIITTLYFTIPTIVILMPISILYEMKMRRKRNMRNRLPDILKSIAKINKVVPNLPKSIKQVEEDTGGIMGKELEKIRNDINMNNDTKNALIRFSNRVKSRDITRTVKLIIKANETTGKISNILEIAARDIDKRKQIEKQRVSGMNQYIMIIAVSFLIYVGIIITLDKFFLNQIDQIAQQTAGQGDALEQTGTLGANPSTIPTDKMRTAFFHSTLIQSITIGIVTGFLRRNNIYAGIKIVIILLTISTLAFIIT